MTRETELPSADYLSAAQRLATSVPGIDASTPVRQIDSIGVIGGGNMGAGITMHFAAAGYRVTLLEVDVAGIDRARAAVQSNHARSINRGKLSAASAAEREALITYSTTIAELAQADLVIEAVFESMALKKQLFRQLDQACKASAILASNTSGLDINQLAAETSRPGDVLGMHFFSPANRMKLMEIVRGDQTAPEVLKSIMQLSQDSGKVAVVAGVCPGFIGNRMMERYMFQANRQLLYGNSPAEIDGAMERWGFAMGPLAVADLAGLDTGYQARRESLAQTDPVYSTVYKVADRLVEQGCHGQKNGKGFYLYDETRARRDNPALAPLIEQVVAAEGITCQPLGEVQLRERLLLSLVNEGAKILAEGIALRASDIDVVFVNGYGFPASRGGPMYWADAQGMAVVRDKLETILQATGDQAFTPAPLITALAESGKIFSVKRWHEQSGGSP